MVVGSIPHYARASTPHVKVSLSLPSEVKVEIDGLGVTSSWSFLNAYAGAIGLGDRVENFQALRSDELIGVTKVASGEFRSAQPADSVRYVIQTASHLVHLPFVSGLTEDFGVFLPADLLPESLRNTELLIEFELPAGWRVESSLNGQAGNRYVVRDPATSSFLAGRSLRALDKSIKGLPVRVVLSGEWAFSEKTVMKSAGEVIEQYYSISGFKLREPPVIFIARLPLSSSSWRAETRGATVTLLFNPQVNVRNWKGQLGIIFSHELFHLWVPNSLALKGDYDWFFEGFTMYVALQVALTLKLIDFDEFLRTLSRVYGSYRSIANDQSLIEASASRWTTSNSLVYDKGMLVAFIFDLTLRFSSQGRSTLTGLYRLLFRSVDEPANANDVIINLLTPSPATLSLGKLYIEGTKTIVLEEILLQFGFQVSNENGVRIIVKKDLTDEQKRLLHSIGYRS